MTTINLITEINSPIQKCFDAARSIDLHQNSMNHFKSMKHQHLFIRENGKTTMKDIFSFESPFGFAGKCFNKLFLENYMRKLLISRNNVIKKYTEVNV